jgi:histone deacetylase 1/2
MGLTLLSHSNLPLKFLDHAFLTAVHLINRLPTASLQFKIPYNILFQKMLDYNVFKPFGCLCFPLLRPYNAYKFDFRSHQCIILGYSNTHKGYKCLSPTGKIFVSKDVLFNETSFPYPSLFSETNTNLPSPTQDIPLSNLPIDSHNLQQVTTQDPEPNDIEIAIHPIPVNTQNNSVITNKSPVSKSNQTSTINNHPMQTRSKNSILLPKQNPKLLLTHTEPKTAKQALADPKWHA